MRWKVNVLFWLNETNLFGQRVAEGGSVNDCTEQEDLKGGKAWTRLD